MKNLLLIWNALLTIAIAVLLYFYFSEKKNIVTPMSTDTISNDSTMVSTGGIAYVNIDSLESNYELFSLKKKEMEAKQQQSQNLFNKKMSDFQDEYQKAQQAAAMMTQSQLASTEESLKNKQAELQQLQDKLQNDFQNQLDAFNIQLKDSLDSYLKDYNKDKKFTYVLSNGTGSSILFADSTNDITVEVVEGMNKRMKK